MRHSVSMIRNRPDLSAFTDRLRAWADGGIGGVWMADHLGLADPFVPLAAAAVAAPSLRLGTLVINHDFWHPGLLARAAGTLASIAPGRVVLGIGAGHAQVEYESLGIEYRRPRARVGSMDAFAEEVQRWLAGDELGLARPDEPPKLLIGGNGDRVLASAARHADVVGLAGFTSGTGLTHTELSHFSWDGLAERWAYVRAQRAAAGGRSLELNVLVQAVAITDDPEAYLRPWSEHVSASVDDLLDCPFVLVGPAGFVREQLARLAEVGVDDVTVFDDGSATALLGALG